MFEQEIEKMVDEFVIPDTNLGWVKDVKVSRT